MKYTVFEGLDYYILAWAVTGPMHCDTLSKVVMLYSNIHYGWFLPFELH